MLQTELEILLNSELGAPQTWRNSTFASVGFPALDYGRLLDFRLWKDYSFSSSGSPNVPTKQKTSLS